ncbi:hypothetical protein [Marinobacter sp.]|uniref:hypothetical protein n=1 Tax=Marinobacter sp. TaxID=50741 RepID=UPI003A8DC74A
MSEKQEVLVRHVREYMQNNRSEIDAPFFSGFPNNCCESASILLGIVLARCYPKQQVYFIKSEVIFGQGMHFWIEAGGSVYDITCDQFKSFSEPIIGGSRSELSQYFSVSEQTEIEKKLVNYDWKDRLTCAAECVYGAIRSNA